MNIHKRNKLNILKRRYFYKIKKYPKVDPVFLRKLHAVGKQGIRLIITELPMQITRGVKMSGWMDNDESLEFRSFDLCANADL